MSLTASSMNMVKSTTIRWSEIWPSRTWEVIHLKGAHEQLWFIRPHKPFSSCAGEQANRSLSRIIKSYSHIEGQSCLWIYTKPQFCKGFSSSFCWSWHYFHRVPIQSKSCSRAAAKQIRSRSYQAFRTIQAQNVRKHSWGTVVRTWTFQDNNHWST